MVLLSQQHIYTTKHFILLSLFKTPGSDPIPSYTGIISTSNSLTHTREFQVLAFFDLEHPTLYDKLQRALHQSLPVSQKSITRNHMWSVIENKSFPGETIFLKWQ